MKKPLILVFTECHNCAHGELINKIIRLFNINYEAMQIK
jgi:hypothetical protein